MDAESFFLEHRLDDHVAVEAGFNPYYPLIGSALDDPLLIGGRAFINLASNNYLGLANDPRVVEAAIEGIRAYGVSMCSTPVAAGYSDLFRQAEEALAGFSRLGSVLILPSCYQANNGLFQAIAHEGDLIVVDRNVHSSLAEGIKASGCKFRPFRHNDLGHLREVLENSRSYRHVLVVTESVFSTEGAIAPFRELCELCSAYGAIPVVDDSHGIGVLGDSGRGILEYAGIEDYQGIYTASLGKAMAVNGGMIAGPPELIRYLRFSMSHLLYSTAILPASLNALLRVIRIVDDEFPAISGRLRDYTRRLREGLLDSGYRLTGDATPIVSVCSGDSLATLRLSRRMSNLGVLGTPFIYPSVPEKEGRIRLIPGANLKEASLERAIAVFRRISNEPG